ncbi:MAG: DUF3313 domain-containing protein [Planctomycetota bacterium]
MRPTRHPLAFSLLLALVAGCASTKSAPPQETAYSGFLEDYSRLEDLEGIGVMSWVQPGLSLAEYDKLLIESELWMSDESQAAVGEDELAQLVSILRALAEEKLGSQWRIVDRPGPTVLHLRCAITELKPANSRLNPLTGVIPVGRRLSRVAELTTGTSLFVGRTSAELEIRDSLSGELLACGVDGRVGANSLSNVGSTWGDVEDAHRFWLGRLAKNLQRLGMQPSVEVDG